MCSCVASGSNSFSVAYFSMEIALESKMPTYSGGLGVLAGDTLKSFADLEMPVIGVSLLYHKGYFKQQINEQGQQKESPVKWKPEDFMMLLPNTVTVEVEGRTVYLKAWLYGLVGVTGHVLPIIFLDANHPKNSAYDKALTDSLYGGDNRYRLCQEVLLGMGGVKMLDSLGVNPDSGLNTYHMNEGHAALLTIALLQKAMWNNNISLAGDEVLQWVSSLCVFTTHTPVPAGHDQFDKKTVLKVLGKDLNEGLSKFGLLKKNVLNMTHLALFFSRYTNGVAKRHGEVSEVMFPEEQIFAITNGVHVPTWTSKPFADLFDKYISAWLTDSYYLRYACDIPVAKIQAAHQKAKKELFDLIKKTNKVTFDEKVFTIGFARRAATYKRADLLFYDAKRLIALAEEFGGLQIVYAGKAHPKDAPGKQLIKNVVKASKSLKKSKIKVVYLENYDMDWGRLITSGVDIWWNNPIKPLEASGTSGMKAALNGVPSFSTLDGWWVEGCFEGCTGWEIEDDEDGLGKSKASVDNVRKKTADKMYKKLQDIILPMYYKNPKKYAEVMRNSIALNASYFNTQRMVQQYNRMAYQVSSQLEDGCDCE